MTGRMRDRSSVSARRGTPEVGSPLTAAILLGRGKAPHSALWQEAPALLRCSVRMMGKQDEPLRSLVSCNLSPAAPSTSTKQGAEPRESMEVGPRSSSSTTAKSALLADAEVVERVCGGETALFEVLMRRYNQRVYRCVRSILRNEVEVEDVMQEVYLAAFCHLGDFEGRSGVATWLTRIAVNEALSRLRTRGRFVGSDPDEEGEDAMWLSPSAARDPEERAITQGLGRALELAVDGLPTSYRTVFVLREVEGLTTLETAQALGLSEPVVKTRLHSAKAQLRERLYARTQQSVGALLPFGAARCDRLVSTVLGRLPNVPEPTRDPCM